MILHAILELTTSFVFSLTIVAGVAAAVPLAHGLQATRWLAAIDCSARTALHEWVALACSDLLLPRPRDRSRDELEAAIQRIRRYRNHRVLTGSTIAIVAVIGVVRLP